VESNENNKIIAAKGELIQKLENKIAKQYETIGNIVELEGMREKMKSKLKYKDSIIDDLKKQVIARKRELGYLSDENQGTSIDKKYESVISSLREELTVKEKTLEGLYAKLEAKDEIFSDLEKQNMKIEELNRTVLNLTEELDFRKEQLSTTEKLINTFRDDFSNAYDKGMRVNKAIKHEFETNLHQAQNKIKDLEDRIKSLEQDRETTKYELRKTDRALSSARKVAMVERNFLEVIKKIENKRKEKKLALDKSLKDRAEQDNEEKKKLRTKIKILKEAYNRLNEQYQSSQVIEKELQNKIKNVILSSYN
jgi:chromosome segregation ATPase